MVELHVLKKFIEEHEKAIKDHDLYTPLIKLYLEGRRMLIHCNLDDKAFAKAVPDKVTKMQVLIEYNEIKKLAGEYIEFLTQFMGKKMDEDILQEWFELGGEEVTPETLKKSKESKEESPKSQDQTQTS